MLIGLVLLVVVIGTVIVIVQQHGGLASHPGPVPPRSLDRRDLDRWHDAALLTSEQVEAIIRFEQGATTTAEAPPPGRAPGRERSSRVPMIAEALGYLGAALAAVGIVLVVANSWDRLAVGLQIGITAGASAALTALGAATARDRDPALVRMQAVVWAAASAAAGACAATVATNGFDVEDGTVVALAVASVVGLHSAALWRNRLQPLQQVVALVALLVAVGAAVAAVETASGWWGGAVWGTSVALIGLGLSDRGSLPPLTAAIGALGSVVGAIAVASGVAGGDLFLVATALVLAAAALVPLPVPKLDRALLGTIGAIASVMSVPGAIAWYAQDAGVATGAVVWTAGAGLVSLGLARRVHLPLLAQGVGAAALLVGAGVTGAQWPDVAPALGLLTAAGLLVVGSRPGAVLESLAGALGLLVYVPWAVGRWFPGEGRAPLLLVVSGLLIVGVAVLIARLSGRLRHELRSGEPHAPA